MRACCHVFDRSTAGGVDSHLFQARERISLGRDSKNGEKELKMEKLITRKRTFASEPKTSGRFSKASRLGIDAYSMFRRRRMLCCATSCTSTASDKRDTDRPHRHRGIERKMEKLRKKEKENQMTLSTGWLSEVGLDRPHKKAINFLLAVNLRHVPTRRGKGYF